MGNLSASKFDAVLGTGKFSVITIQNWAIWTTIGILLAVMLAFYVLRSIGLYVLSKRQNISKAYLAFIPCVWIYLACKLIGNSRFLGSTFEKLALLITIIFSVAGVLTLIYDVLTLLPLFEYVFVYKQNLYIASSESVDGLKHFGYGLYVVEEFVPYGNALKTINKIMLVLDVVSPVFDILSIVATISIYINLFRKFWPQHFMLAALLCIFLDLFPILIFVIKDRNPVNYNDYLRSRYSSYNNRYNNPYNNQYNNSYDPFANSHNNTQGKSGDPFENQKQDPGDPFDVDKDN